MTIENENLVLSYNTKWHRNNEPILFRNERPDLYEYQQTIFKRFNMKKNLEVGGTRAKFGQSELLKGFSHLESYRDIT